MTTRDIEQITGLAAQAVGGIMDRAEALVNDPDIQKTGCIEIEDPVMGEIVSITFTDKNALSAVRTHLKYPTRHLRFDEDGEVTREFGRGTQLLFSGGEVNSDLSPRDRRRAVGYIATAHELFNDLVDSRYAPTE